VLVLQCLKVPDFDLFNLIECIIDFDRFNLIEYKMQIVS
jgi:hypothetical protein